MLTRFFLSKSKRNKQNKSDRNKSRIKKLTTLGWHFSFLHSNPRGPGFWKLNTSILSKTDNVKQIKKTIKETLDEYSEDETVNLSLLSNCYMVKLKVREKSWVRCHQKMHMQSKLQHEIAILEEDRDKAEKPRPFGSTFRPSFLMYWTSRMKQANF